jgi:diguanylate cyclase (GGDEF)-like protein
LISILPIFVALVYALGYHSRLEAYHASHALVLCFVYFYNFLMLRRNAGFGARVFRFSLVLLAAAFLEHAVILLYLYNAGAAPAWARYLHHETYYDLILHCVLAFAAMAMWSESQIDRIRDLSGELAHLRREVQHSLDLDRLTGLFNQAALAARVEGAGAFDGVVTVCDMDNFKDINDRYGHLVGDEILRNIGNLLRSSIRHEDEAFRWGGDEFVVLFHNQQASVAAKRMNAIEARLRDFRVRGYGVLPISFSWGTAEANGRSLREALDEADRSMYALKRSRATGERSTAR